MRTAFAIDSTRLRLLGVFALILVSISGCTRRFWRERADREVDGILTEKNCYDQWKIDAYHLTPDGRARFSDHSCDPDRPPMPPDDEAARCLSPNPQKADKSGCGNPEGTGYLELVAAWDQENRAKLPASTRATVSIASIAGPPPKNQSTYEQTLESKEKPYLLTVDQACELALFNSREFQDQRENLYLSALPVTLERFAFASQFFATEQLIREHTGRSTPEGHGNRWRANTGLELNQLFPTGALLLVKFANQVVVNMAAAGTPRVLTPSSISLDITQPLLRDGGKAVTLEPLTQAERNLLYQVRGYSRFRKEFFVAIAAGGGGAFGNSFANSPVLPASGSNAAEGYYPTMLREAILENQRQNVKMLEAILAFYRGYLEGGDVSQLQVDQVELDLLNGRSAVLQQNQLLSDALDRFKLQLGVPTSMPIKLDNATFRPLIDQQQRFLQLVTQYEDARGIINRSDWPAEPEKLRERLTQMARESPVTRGSAFAEEFPKRWSELASLSQEQFETRKSQLKNEQIELLARQNKAQSEGQAVPADIAPRLRDVERSLELIGLEESTRRFLGRTWQQPGMDAKRLKEARDTAYRDVASDFVVVMGNARDERLAKVRQQWPKLPPVCLNDSDLLSQDLDQAVAIASQAALSNRLDLMNARARVVDAWRKIAVRANALMGILNVRYHLDGATFAGTQPFDFDPQQTRHQLVINGELPLVRQAERNDYRAALIAFQRNRRILQGAEDSVLSGVRSELRQLRFLAENYKIQQRAVELSYNQVENALATLKAPPRVFPAGQGGGAGGGDTTGNQAALTRQLLDAVSTMLRAQNQLYTVYQNYLVTRLQLYRDLELMQLDSRGVWCDDINCQTSEPGPAAGSPDRPNAPAILPEPIRIQAPTNP